VAALLAEIPAAAGVVQILGPEGRNLLIGAPANLKRWTASHLGAGPVLAKGQRPRTDLRGLATAVAFEPTTSPFHQRLTYERLMARHVAPGDRRDLKRPFFLHLDPAERFPRLTVRPADADLGASYGPFRDRGAAEKARTGLHKLIPLRPCDYVFEPDPALPLGLGCLYAQVRSCAAPCLSRVTEDAYRGLARDAAALLADPAARTAPPAWLPATVGPAEGHGLVVGAGKAGFELYPVESGAVLEAARVAVVDAAGLDSAVADLRWPASAPGQDDWPWLSAWLWSPRGRGSYVVVPESLDRPALARSLRERLFPDPIPA
jgi:hypothetical protein